MRGPRTAMKSGPRLPQLEKALAQKRRPNTAINKNKKNKIKKKDSGASKCLVALWGGRALTHIFCQGHSHLGWVTPDTEDFIQPFFSLSQMSTWLPAAVQSHSWAVLMGKAHHSGFLLSCSFREA